MTLRTACGILALGVAVGPARAASSLEPPDLSRYLKWGPARVRPGFAVPHIGYDDNVFNLSSGRPPEGDYTARLSPRIEGVLMLGHVAFLTFKERLDYTVYADHSELNFFDNIGSARLTFPLRRMGFYTDFALNRIKDPPVGELDSRPIRRERRAGAGIILKLGWRTEAEIGVVRSDWKHTDPDYLSPDGFTIADLLNRLERGRQAKLRYRLTGSTRLTLDATNESITFDNPAVARDAKETVIAPGIEFGEGGTVSGSLRVGSAHLDAKSPAQPDLSTPVGEAKLAWRLSTATTLRLEASKRTDFAVYQSNRYFKQAFYETRIVHYLNRAFGVEGAAGLGRLSFPEAPQAAARADRIRTYDAGVRFRLWENPMGRRMEYTLGLRRWQRDSTQDSLDQSRTLVGFGASVGF